jgi:hypothetical protein
LLFYSVPNQTLLGVRADRRRAREKMLRVSAGLWDDRLLLAIPEADDDSTFDSSGGGFGFGGGGGIELTTAKGAALAPPEDNPYALIKRKVRLYVCVRES